MGRSMATASEPQSLERVATPITVFDQEQNRHFQIFRQGSDIYQSEYALNPEGQEQYRQTEKIVYVMGAGSQGIGHIIRRGDYLFEAPLSFYTGPKTWGLSPGYESNNLGFSRPILDDMGSTVILRSANSPLVARIVMGREDCMSQSERKALL
jgi:hypothetical protein